jgi:hypothetical protein
MTRGTEASNVNTFHLWCPVHTGRASFSSLVHQCNRNHLTQCQHDSRTLKCNSYGALMFFASWVTQWSELSWSHSLQHSSRHYLHIIALKGKLSITETYKRDNKITHIRAMWRWHFICNYWISSFTQREKPCIEHLLRPWNHHRRVERERERERTAPSNLTTWRWRFAVPKLPITQKVQEAECPSWSKSRTAWRWRFAVPKLPITQKVQEAECPSWSKPRTASYQGHCLICSPKTANSVLFTAWSIAFPHKDTHVLRQARDHKLHIVRILILYLKQQKTPGP